MRRALSVFYIGVLFAGGLVSCTVSNPVISGPAAPPMSDMYPANLRCEYRTDPVGVDVARPRFSWTVQCDNPVAHGKVQSAYQILVASTSQQLAADEADLWDSGKVPSNETNQIVYNGKALKPEELCFWTVRTWDESNKASPFSEPAKWSSGLMDPVNWHAKWIGYDAGAKRPPRTSALAGADWIWFPEGDPTTSAPIGNRFFRHIFTLPNDRAVVRAEILLIADNAATVFINGKKAGTANGWARVTRVEAGAALHPGDNMVAIAAGNTGDAPNPAGIAGKVIVTFTTGQPLELPLDDTWKTAQTDSAGWENLDFKDGPWESAKIIAKVGDKPWGEPTESGDLFLPPPPYLRKDFTLDKPVRRATLCASALGIFEMHLNGQRVGQDYFMPGYTDYRKRVYYAAYDVTGQLKEGSNSIGGILGDGWYAGYLAWMGKRNFFGPATRLGAQLDIEFADGSTRQIITDDSWRASYGPILHADMLHGCAYDPRKEMPGWDAPGFDESQWKPVDVSEKIALVPSAYPADGVRRDDELATKAVTEPLPGEYVFDLGQNMVGWVRLKVSGAPGQKITVRHGEMLNPDGTVYTANLRSARATDEYFLKGNGEETFEPYFTFHGFRYVQVSGLTSEPAPAAVTGIVVHSAMERTGHFECSNPMLNQLYSNIIWGQKGNYFDIPTDCPQRDERQGWMGDAQVFVRTAACNYDIAGFFTKWLVDVGDAQLPDGAFSVVSPNILPDLCAGWGDAGVICSWTVYHVYGDKRIIEAHYDQMARWIAFLQQRSHDGLSPDFGPYGDWLNVDQPTPKDVIATAYFGQSTRLLAEMAHAIGREDDAKKYDDLFQQIRSAFTTAFVSDDGTVKGDSQTGYLLALRFDLVPEEKRPALAAHLVERIQARDWHLSTGFLGVNLLLPTLRDVGRTDVAYRLLENTTYPSWGYSVVNGATTIWERWNSYTREKGFGDVGMNSFNHYSYGSCAQWMFSTIGGIDTDGPGFRNIVIHPQPGGDLTYAKTSYESINGLIATDWKRENDALSLNVTIPPNTAATILVPATEKSVVTQHTQSIGATYGLQGRFDPDEKAVVYQVGSGNYSFGVR